jgi:hypothetical protein
MHEYEKGDYFAVSNDPRVDGMVITEVGNIGYDGYRVLEKDTDTDNWRHYWMKAQHLHDEVNIGGLEHAKKLDEETLAEAKESVEIRSPDNASPVPEVTVGDVMERFVDYSVLPTNHDGSVDEERLENDPDAPELPEESNIGE